MKKASVVIVLLFLGLVFQGYSQTAPKDFFAGAWEISVFDTPNGDAKLKTTLTRTNGKLTGVLSDANNPSAPKMTIEQVIENPDSISILFFAEGTDVNIDLKKKDVNNLEGTLMGMFTAKAKRLGKP
ncbi:hypothetical protein J0A68_17595 [Algoriphagus sp. H41]|uniref:DUF4488 domain-containing protein n=1 Tax=Algoriphagus oliviformis TaxID=2811231 RepID=A0ABS3C6P4_9BACT|nr:hypothetical protein [Algoriphagus oliviformis]MBN7812773.1 hypothetical protein [Algoriphagus oliviformis]